MFNHRKKTIKLAELKKMGLKCMNENNNPKQPKHEALKENNNARSHRLSWQFPCPMHFQLKNKPPNLGLRETLHPAFMHQALKGENEKT